LRETKPRQGRDEVLRQAVAESLKRRFATQIVERQHRQAGPERSLTRSRCCRRRGRRAQPLHAPSAHRTCDVFDLLFADVGKPNLELAAHLLLHEVRHANATGIGQLLQACCDVHAVAEDVVAVNDDVANVYADAERDAVLPRDVGVVRSHRGLDADDAAHGINYARELQQQPVARRLDDAPAVLADFRVDHRAPQRLQGSQRTALIAAHKPRVARNVG
jgi:hypothetical protein